MTVNMLWFLLFNAFSVYFASQTLQMSHYIKNTAHNTVSSFSLVYDALYSIMRECVDKIQGQGIQTRSPIDCGDIATILSFNVTFEIGHT